MILGYLIIALFFFAILHFVIDGILAPTEQMIARQKLLSIAVELKSQKKHKSKDAKEVNKHLYNSANTLIANIPRYTVWNLTKFRGLIARNERLRQSIFEKSKWVDENSDEFLIQKRKDISKEADRILAWNSMSWALYVLPIIFTLAFFKKIQKVIDSSILVGQKLTQYRSESSNFAV